MKDQTQRLSPSSFHTFGELLGFLRKRAHVSQRELATYVGYHYSHISRVEKNIHTPDVNTVKALFIPALALDAEPEWADRLVILAQGDQAKSPAAEKKSSAGHVYRLPANLTSMLGREIESRSLVDTMLRDDIRMLSIIGPPGVGKTRMALDAAEKLSEHFSNGAVFVNLAPVENSNMVMSAISEALGLQETSTTHSLANLQSFLHDKNLLIVMDNFEQLLAAAEQISTLMHHAPEVKIIVTSRESLRIQGEYEFQLTPLPLPEENSNLEDSPAVQLFIERARSIDSNFRLTQENGSRVTEICRRLDGLPLAIELAAARVRTLSLKVMLEQFDRRFDWLTRGTRDTPAWRQTLQGAIEWSYNLLSESDRVLLRRLSVFAGGWTLEAAEVICHDTKLVQRAIIMNVLLQLVDRSLVVAEAREESTRYRFLDTIRHFAHDKLDEANETTKYRNRHLKFFTEWTENSESLLDRASPLELRAIIELEHNNMRAALDWGLQKEANVEDALKLSIATGFIWLKHSHFKEALEWVERYLPHAQAHPAHHVRLLYLGAALSYWRDNSKQALAFALQAEKMGRKLNDKKLLANILYYLSEIYREAKDFKRAKACLEESILLCRETNHYSRLSLSLTSLSVVLYQLNDRKKSVESIKEAMQIAIREKIPWGQSFALRVQANNLRFDGKFVESLEAYKLALNLSDAIDDRISAGMALANMSMLANVLEDYSASLKYAERAFTIFQAIGNEYQQPYPFRLMAYSALHMGDPVQARTLCMESLTRNYNLGEGHEIGVSASIIALAEIELSNKNYEKSAQLLNTGERFLKEYSFKLQEADASALGRVKKGLGSRLSPTKVKAALANWENLDMNEAYQKILNAELTKFSKL